MPERALSGSHPKHRRPPPWVLGPGVGVLLRAWAVATAALLTIDAYVHFHDAGFYDSVAPTTLNEATLFRAQAAAAIVVAIALLLRPYLVVWAVAVLVAGSAFGAVLLYTYVDVGKLGPLPDMYEPTWVVPGKRASAVAEGLATLLALIGLVIAVRTRVKTRRHVQGRPDTSTSGATRLST
jgi:hypothetical protein